MAVRHLWIVMSVMTALASWGCELRDGGCVSDEECRRGRVCASGICSGLIDLETDAGNTSTNNATKNATTGPTNNVSTNNSGGCDCADDEWCDAATEECVPACQSAEECTEPGAPVCSWLHEDPDRLTCVAAEMCGFTGGFGQEGSCGFTWECADGIATVECRLRDDGSSNCTCTRANGAEIGEFEFDGDICTTPDAAIADATNIGCGWRLQFTVDF